LKDPAVAHQFMVDITNQVVIGGIMLIVIIVPAAIVAKFFITPASYGTAAIQAFSFVFADDHKSKLFKTVGSIK